MILEAASVVVDTIFWLVEFLVRGLIGWRFLLSTEYRARTLARWQQQPSSATALEVAGGAAGVLISGLLIAWVVLTLIRP